MIVILNGSCGSSFVNEHSGRMEMIGNVILDVTMHVAGKTLTAEKDCSLYSYQRNQFQQTPGCLVHCLSPFNVLGPLFPCLIFGVQFSQVSPRSILSGIRPVCTSGGGPYPPGFTQFHPRSPNVTQAIRVLLAVAVAFAPAHPGNRQLGI
jgi:hypothetical protein